MTKLKLIRKWFTENSTIGELYINDVFFCYVLEDKDRGLKQTDSLTWIKAKKIFGVTCIPYGVYKCRMSMSNRFKRLLLEILDVKGFEGIRGHRGNTAVDSLGCLIYGFKKGYDTVFESTKAELAILEKLKDSTEIELEITK